MKLSELLRNNKFEINQSPLLVIAAIRDKDPTNAELLAVHQIPFRNQE